MAKKQVNPVIKEIPAVKKSVNKSKKKHIQKRLPVKLMIKTDIESKSHEQKALPEKMLVKLEKSNSFDELRKQNLSSFKSAIEPHIIDLEVNFARINTEEKLASSGNVIYLTEKEYEQAGLRLPPQQGIDEYAKRNKAAKNDLLWTAASLIASLIIVAGLYKMKQNARLYFEL